MTPVSSIIFCGTSAFAVPSLEALAKDPAFRVDLVITQPDKPVGRSQMLTPPPIKIAAKRLGLKIIQPPKINEWLAQLITINPSMPLRASQKPITDFLVVVSYGQILSQEVLDLPKIAPVNVHASLLPRFRGASPLQHAILAGDKESGVTIQKIVKELDAGPILAQEKTPIDAVETTATLHDRLATMGADLLLRTLKNPLHSVEQDPANITLCRKLTREDGVVDPQTMTAEEIDRTIRALTPWPGVTAIVRGKTIKILEASLTETMSSISLPCVGGTLFLNQIQEPGKKPMQAKDWERGVR